MEHHNPLLTNTDGHKFITFGEIMLRLTPPNYEKIRVATNFEVSYAAVKPTSRSLLPTSALTAHSSL